MMNVTIAGNENQGIGARPASLITNRQLLTDDR